MAHHAHREFELAEGSFVACAFGGDHIAESDCGPRRAECAGIFREPGNREGGTMSCGGKSRIQFRIQTVFDPPPVGAAAFEYIGTSRVTVIGPVTHTI
jgi:hypothetical protein